MSDLISREKALQALIEYRGYVIDQDGEMAIRLDDLKEVLDEIPTEFDVDKVMDELKEQSYELDFNGEYENSNVIDSEIAIEVVKKGGVE